LETLNPENYWGSPNTLSSWGEALKRVPQGGNLLPPKGGKKKATLEFPNPIQRRVNWTPRELKKGNLTSKESKSQTPKISLSTPIPKNVVNKGASLLNPWVIYGSHLLQNSIPYKLNR